MSNSGSFEIVASKQHIMEQAALSKDHAHWVDEIGNGIYSVPLVGADWSGIVLPDVDFNMFMASQSNFDNAQLERVNFVHTSLYQCSFRAANLTEADFYEADMREACFEGACLFRADLTKTILFRSQSAYANFEETACSAGFNDSDLRESSFARANLDRTTFAHADLRGADFRFANFGRWGSCEGADFARANLTGARIPINRLAQARNIDQVIADWIIVSDEYDTRYMGDRAHQWLREQAALPRPPLRPPTRR